MYRPRNRARLHPQTPLAPAMEGVETTARSPTDRQRYDTGTAHSEGGGTQSRLSDWRSARVLAAASTVPASAAWMVPGWLSRSRCDAISEGLQRRVPSPYQVRSVRQARLLDQDPEHGHEDGVEPAGGLGVEQVDAVALGQGVGVLPVAGVHIKASVRCASVLDLVSTDKYYTTYANYTLTHPDYSASQYTANIQI